VTIELAAITIGAISVNETANEVVALEPSALVAVIVTE
jgi:hypothetical protein